MMLNEERRRAIQDMVCDSSKFGRRSLSLITPHSGIREVITDGKIQKAALRVLAKAGIKVTIV